MNHPRNIVLLSLLAMILIACNGTEPEPLPDPDPNATITLDELGDMEDYEQGMVVDSRLFNELRVNRIVLNDVVYEKPLSLDLTSAGYYRIEVYSGNASGLLPEVIRLVVLDPERGQAEWALPPWTPRGVELQTLAAQKIQLIHPGAAPAGQPFPVLVLAEGELTRSLDNFMARVASTDFLVKRGVGSVWLVQGDPSQAAISLDQRTLPVSVSAMPGPPRVLGGTLQENLHLEAGSYANIDADLYIPAGVVMQIDSGAFITVDPAINIYNQGILRILGSGHAPVVITCSGAEDYWGGFIATAPESRFEVSHAILGRSGFHTGGDYDWGHAHRQALIYCVQGSVALDHCYMIDHIGQAIYTESADLEMEYCLVQRVKTGGQLNGTRVSINHCVFTDFPDDSDIYRDQDNDGLYLVECVAEINNSIFMYAKDDCLDSGGGTVDGEVTVRNSRFESAFHEGAALSGGSSAGKTQHFYNCVFVDCGQGMELGYSSNAHYVFADSCTFLRNGIGIRYGDNYDFPHRGYISVSNSSSLENTVYDVWNMNREYWAADTFHMEFDHVLVSSFHPMYPQLMVQE